MPQYSFSSIASLATSQKREAPGSSDGLQQPAGGARPYQPVYQPFQPHQAHIQQEQQHLQQALHHQQQHQFDQANQQLRFAQHPAHGSASGAIQSLQQLQQLPAAIVQQATLPKTTLASSGAKNFIEFGRPPVNEHDIDSPTSTAVRDDQAEGRQHLPGGDANVGPEDPGSGPEVRQTVVTQQPQVHPGKVPPLVITTRIQTQPTMTLPKQEQLPDEEDCKANDDDKEISKADEDSTDQTKQISDRMEVDVIEKEDGSRDVCTMTGHGMNERTMLDGMILTETTGGLLVVNVMYKNKEFFGTLMECASSSHTWGAPRHSEIPPPDKKPKKKKKSKSSDNRLAPRIGLRNRRRMKRRDKREKRLSWDRTNRPAKSNKKITL